LTERNISIKEVMDTIVPITRFNRGEASKIFDEVDRVGVKVVLKNNAAACVLVQPERYDEMVEALEDYALFFEAERRMKSFDGERISHSNMMKELGIQETDLEGVEVETD